MHLTGSAEAAVAIRGAAPFAIRGAAPFASQLAFASLSKYIFIEHSRKRVHETGASGCRSVCTRMYFALYVGLGCTLRVTLHAVPLQCASHTRPSRTNSVARQARAYVGYSDRGEHKVVVRQETADALKRRGSAMAQCFEERILLRLSRGEG